MLRLRPKVRVALSRHVATATNLAGTGRRRHCFSRDSLEPQGRARWLDAHTRIPGRYSRRILPSCSRHFAAASDEAEKKRDKSGNTRETLVRQLTTPQSGPRHIFKSLVEHIWPSGGWGGLTGPKSRVCLALGLMLVPKAQTSSRQSCER